MKTLHHFLVFCVAISLCTVAHAATTTIPLISKENLSGAKGTSQNFSFKVGSSIPTGSLSTSFKNLATYQYVNWYLSNTDNPKHYLTGSYSNGVYTIYGLIPGNWNIEVRGTTAYSGFKFTFNGIQSDKTLVTDLPYIMDANKWPKGAALLNKWFNSAEGTTDTSIITVDWALGFSRLKSIYDSIFSDTIYINAAAQKLLADSLKNTASSSFQTNCNFRAYPGRALEACTIGFDDLDVALNACTLDVVAAGTVSAKVNGKKTVTIQKVGVYISDSFNFTGEQNLAYWNKLTNYAGCNFLKGTSFGNSSFRSYKAETGRGRDFSIQSEIKWTTLKTPVSFTFQ